MKRLLQYFGGQLAAYLTRPSSAPYASPATNLDRLRASLRPGDVLLVEGNFRISTVIKYLTQSTWSHAALYVGDVLGRDADGKTLCFIEADAVHGIRGTSIHEYEGLHTRICRPVGLTSEDADRVIAYAKARLGHRYDLKNVIDLARYLFRTPPVPVGWRRRMLALGSGDPSRAICSTLLAQAFQSVRYPILPVISREMVDDPTCRDCVREIMHIRHHSLFVPRDFDVSPYFEIVKPSINPDLDYRQLEWALESD